MDIRVYDKELNALGVIDETASVIWTIMYFAVGEVKILAPITENNRNLLQAGNVVVKHDEYNDYVADDTTIWRRAAEITYVHYQKDENGQEQIEARGYMITRWLNQRVITPQIQMTGTQQDIVNALILRNVGSKASTKRQFPQFTVLPQETIAGTSVDYSNEALKALGDEVRDQCQQESSAMIYWWTRDISSTASICTRDGILPAAMQTAMRPASSPAISIT